MAIDKVNYKGDPNIGFYGVVTSKYTLLPKELKGDVFSLENIVMRIGGEPFTGLFAAGNINGLVLPEVTKKRKIKKLEEKNINYKVLETNFTALGNLILCNDTGAIISKELSDQKEIIEEVLDVKVKVSSIGGLDIPGSCGIANSNGVLLHRNATDEEIEKVEETLGVEAGTGSVNFGSPYVGTGILANNESLLLGDKCTGPETVRIQDSLKVFE